MNPTELKGRLLRYLAAHGPAVSPADAARELLQLDAVTDALAVKLLEPLVIDDVRVALSRESISLTSEELGLGLQEFAVVDVETTGLAMDFCRMTEIAVVVVRGDGEVLDEYASLVNPGVPIPHAIVELTGITDDMVALAPDASEVLPRALALLKGRQVVAHSAAFDARFVADELRHSRLPRLEVDWLCTKRLARRVVPKLRTYGLDSLQAHFGVRNTMRHRALGDARATAEILGRLIDLSVERGCKTAEDLVLLSRTRRPMTFSHRDFDPAFLDALPNVPGIYRMLDEEGAVVYVGKSVQLRNRVWSYFRPGATGKARRIAGATHRVEVEEQGSELLALLAEARQIRAHEPRFNKQKWNFRGHKYFKVTAEKRPRLVSTRDARDDLHQYFGPFPPRCAGRRTAQALRDVFTLRDARDDPGRFPDACMASAYEARLDALIQLLEGRDSSAVEYAREQVSRRNHRQQFSLAARWRRIAELMETLYKCAAQIGPDVTNRSSVILIPSSHPEEAILMAIVRGRPVAHEVIGREQTSSLNKAVRRLLAACKRAPEPVLPPSAEEADDVRIVHSWLSANQDDPSWVDLGSDLDGRSVLGRARTALSDPDLFVRKLYV